MEYLKKLFAPVDMTVGKPWENTGPRRLGGGKTYKKAFLSGCCGGNACSLAKDGV